MEASKERLTRDTVRHTTEADVQDIKRENPTLEKLIAELSLQAHMPAITAMPGLQDKEGMLE